MKASAFCLLCLAIGWATLATVSAISGHQQQQLQEAQQW